jgi:hypothetical protein
MNEDSNRAKAETPADEAANGAGKLPSRSSPRFEAMAGSPVNAAFDQGCWRRRPRGSFAPIARAPSSPRTAISLKWKSATSVSSRSAGPGRSSSIAPPKPKCAAPDSSATTRQGIKNTTLTRMLQARPVVAGAAEPWGQLPPDNTKKESAAPWRVNHSFRELSSTASGNIPSYPTQLAKQAFTAKHLSIG